MRVRWFALGLLIATPALAQMTTAGAPNRLPPPSLGLGYPGTPPPTTPGPPPTTPGPPPTTPGLPATTPGPAGGGLLTPPPELFAPGGFAGPAVQPGTEIPPEMLENQ